MARFFFAQTQVRAEFFCHTRVGSNRGRIRRAAVYLWNACHGGRIAADCGALGLGAAIFLAELAPQKISDTLQFFIDLLAAVPSVIYGLLGVFIVIPLMREYLQPF